MTTPGHEAPTGHDRPTALSDSPTRPLDTSRPHPGRRYDALLGGKDNFAADRESAAQIAAVFPSVRIAAVENRRFLGRVVAFLAQEAGIRQFLDVGTGIPTSPNVHEIAQRIAPESRIVYVDNDPIMLSHARALMVSKPNGAVAYVDADLRDPDTILTAPALHRTLNLKEPVALLLIAVLHFLEDSDGPYRSVAQLVDALPPGSYVALSHVTFDPLPADTVAQLTALVAPGSAHGPFRARSRDEITGFLDGLTLVDPGLVPIVNWRLGQDPKPEASMSETAVYGAVGRVPSLRPVQRVTAGRR